MGRGPKTGDEAPDFELDGTDGRFKLSDHRGEKVVILFYPGDDTPVCTKQFCSYRDKADDMSELGATVVGISAQSVESHRKFTDKHGLNIPLLADVGGEVASAYGISAPILGTRRAVFIVDEQGTVRYRHLHALGISYQSADELRSALDGIATRV